MRYHGVKKTSGWELGVRVESEEKKKKRIMIRIFKTARSKNIFEVFWREKGKKISNMERLDGVKGGYTPFKVSNGEKC